MKTSHVCKKYGWEDSGSGLVQKETILRCEDVLRHSKYLNSVHSIKKILFKNFTNITEILFLLQLLVERNPEGLHSRDNRGWQPIHEAAFNGNEECLRYVFRVFLISKM